MMDLMRGRLRMALAVAAATAVMGIASAAAAQPCLIFVHGKQTNTNTYTSWSSARNYWKNGTPRLRPARPPRTSPTSYYVVGYNGTRPYWESQSAGEVANEIVNATNGGADGGGNRCARTYAQGGTFWVIGHSMAGTVMDYILGNNDATRPELQLQRPLRPGRAARSAWRSRSAARTAARRAPTPSAATATSSATSSPLFIQSCDDATYWLRSADDVQVRTFSNAPARKTST